MNKKRAVNRGNFCVLFVLVVLVLFSVPSFAKENKGKVLGGQVISVAVKGRARINIGGDKGVAFGMKFTLLRDGNVLGIVEVKELYADTAIIYPVDEKSNLLPKVGDIVVASYEEEKNEENKKKEETKTQEETTTEKTSEQPTSSTADTQKDQTTNSESITNENKPSEQPTNNNVTTTSSNEQSLTETDNKVLIILPFGNKTSTDPKEKIEEIIQNAAYQKLSKSTKYKVLDIETTNKIASQLKIDKDLITNDTLKQITAEFTKNGISPRYFVYGSLLMLSTEGKKAKSLILLNVYDINKEKLIYQTKESYNKYTPFASGNKLRRESVIGCIEQILEKFLNQNENDLNITTSTTTQPTTTNVDITSLQQITGKENILILPFIDNTATDPSENIILELQLAIYEKFKKSKSLNPLDVKTTNQIVSTLRYDKTLMDTKTVEQIISIFSDKQISVKYVVFGDLLELKTDITKGFIEYKRGTANIRLKVMDANNKNVIFQNKQSADKKSAPGILGSATKGKGLRVDAIKNCINKLLDQFFKESKIQ